MKKLMFGVLILLLPGVASAQISLVGAQAEADAWIETRLAGLTSDFQACVAAKELRFCHPTWSSTVLPNTDPSDSALATVTNNDPGPFVQSVCGNCYDDTRDTWVLAGVDIPGTSPVQLRTNTYSGPSGVGVQVAYRFQYDGVIWEKGIGLFSAPDFDWREVEE